jgi:type IV secretory pathway VirB2 component (pilin)
MNYFIYQDDQEKGPYSYHEIIWDLNANKITGSTMVRMEDSDQWMEVSALIDQSIAQRQEQRAQAQAESIRQVQQALSDVSQWMSRNQGTVIIVILLIVIGAQFFSQVKPAVKWEYKLESPSDYSFTKTMNNYGEEGWELVSARRASDSSSSMSYECIFKRPK